MRKQAHPRLRFLVAGAFFLAALGLLGGGIRPVSAHAIVVSTDPIDGAQLSSAPKQARVCFSEEVVLKLSSFSLVDGNGNALPVTVAGASDAPDTCLVAQFPPLSPNLYRLSWKATSADDLHLTPGALIFGYGQAVTGAGQTESYQPGLGEVLLRGIDFAGSAVLLGGWLLFWILSGLGTRLTEERTWGERLGVRALKLGLAGGLVGLVGRVGLVAYQAVSLNGTSGGILSVDELWQTISGSNYGVHSALAGVELILNLGVIIFLLNQRPLERRSSRQVQVGLAAGVLLIVGLAWEEGLISHANSFTDYSAFRIGMEVVHLLAAWLWVGGLVGVALLVGPWLRKEKVERGWAWQALLRFSPLAAGATAILVVTGLYNTGQQVASLDALLTTLYGQGLLVKLGLIGLTLLLALYHTTRLHAGLQRLFIERLHLPANWFGDGSGRLGPTLAVEALGGLGVLLLVGLMSAAQPGRGPQFDPPPVVNAPITTGQVGDLLVTFSMKPNRVGPNFVEIGVFETRKPAVAPVESVKLKLTALGSGGGMTEFEALPIGGGRFQVNGVSLGQAGAWQVELDLARQGGGKGVYTTAWDVNAGGAPRQVLVSNKPLAPAVNLAALTLGICISAIVLATWFMRKRRSDPVEGVQVLKKP